MSVQGERPPAGGGAITYSGPVRVDYRPHSDGQADAGEVVWAWVAFEDDPSVGKDRPLVLIGWTRDNRLAALMLSSRDHLGDRGWLRLGKGSWDREGRSSWVRVDRLLAISPAAVRREGATLPRRTFNAIIDALLAEPSVAPSIVRRRRGLLPALWRLIRPNRSASTRRG